MTQNVTMPPPQVGNGSIVAIYSVRARGNCLKGKPAEKYSQAARLHRLIRLLETRRALTLDDMAEECGVNRRTIHRDLNAIEEAGYTLATDMAGTRKTYSFLSSSRNLPPITFTLPQLMSLYLLRSLGAYFGGTPFQTEIESLFKTVHSVLPDRYAAHLERIARVSLPLIHGARDYSGVAPFIADLKKALLYQYTIRLGYSRKGAVEAENYDVDPYTLLFSKGGIYLQGRAHNRSGIRLFALERIRALTLTRQRFDIPEDYQPEEYFGGAFGLVGDEPMQVSVRFSAEVAHTIKNRFWMPAQSLTSEKAGSVTLSFTAAGMMELVAWILSYGSHAEVLEPEILRSEVLSQIAAMKNIYDQREASP